MSLGIAFKGPEGIVLAADSRVTLNAPLPLPIQPGIPTQPQIMLLPATYDNATKLLRVNGQQFVGAVTYGVGAIGQQQPRTAHSYMPEFEAELTTQGCDRLTVAEFAKKLSDFFIRQWREQMPANLQGQDMVFLVGGYDDGEPYGKIFDFYIPSRPEPQEQQCGTFGMVWGGQREYTDRLMQGFDDQLLPITAKFFNAQPHQMEAFRNQLKNILTVRIPWLFLPLQDCVDLSIFLIRTTISLQKWIVGVRGVGGAIDVVTITRTEGLKTVQQKSIVGEPE